MADAFLHDWDERYHALVAKNLAENPLVPMLFKTPVLPYDFQQWTLSHVWLHKQPLTLWLMAASIKIFGTTEFAVRFPSLILSVIGIYLTFRIATFFSNERTGLLAAFFQSINGLVIQIATGREATDHIDNTFFFFIELAVFGIVLFLERKKTLNLLLIGLWLGLALLSKYLPALIVLPLFILLTVDQNGYKKTLINTLYIVFTAALIAMPWQIYIFKTFPIEANWESHYNFLHLTQALEKHDGTFLRHFYWATEIWNVLIPLVMLWFFYQLYQNRTDKKLWALATWIGIPYTFFSIVATKMVAYPLFVAPAIFTIIALFCVELLGKPLTIKWLNPLILSILFFFALRYTYICVQPFAPTTEKAKITKILRGWKNQMPSDGKAVIFNTPYYVEMMFYHNIAAAYPNLPTEEQIKDLQGKGYRIMVVKNEAVPTNMLNKNGVQFLSEKAMF